MDTYEKTKSEIIEFMNGPRLVAIFEGASKDIKEIISKIFICIEKLQKDEKIDEKDDNNVSENDLNKITDLLMYYSLERQTSETDINVLKNMSMLIFNYNKNTLDVKSISIRVSFLENFLNGFLTFRDCIHLFKSLSERLNRFTTYNPPSFDLSKHYIDTVFGCPDECVEKTKE